MTINSIGHFSGGQNFMLETQGFKMYIDFSTRKVIHQLPSLYVGR